MQAIPPLIRIFKKIDAILLSALAASEKLSPQH
jgi:hypothetical protein